MTADGGRPDQPACAGDVDIALCDSVVRMAYTFLGWAGARLNDLLTVGTNLTVLALARASDPAAAWESLQRDIGLHVANIVAGKVKACPQCGMAHASDLHTARG